MRYIANIKRFLLSFLLYCLVVPGTSFAQATPVINEVSVHPSGESKEWVEIVSPQDTVLSNYWIDDDTSFTDDAGNGIKKRLESISPGYESGYYLMELTSLFNNASDSVVLFDGTGMIVDQYSYTQDPGVDVTLGRYPNALGSFHILASPSKGEHNNPPAPTITPTPLSTEKPTATEKPEKESSSKNTPTKMTSDSIDDDSASFGKPTPSQKASQSAFPKRYYPSPILRVSTNSANKKEASKSAKKKAEVLVKDIQTVVPKAAPFLLAGSVLLVSCGILLYNKIRRS